MIAEPSTSSSETDTSGDKAASTQEPFELVDVAIDQASYSISIANKQDTVVDTLSSRAADIALVPVSMLGDLFNELGDEIQMIGTCALSCYYTVCHDGSMDNILSLSNRAVYVWRGGSTATAMFNYLFERTDTVHAPAICVGK